MDIIISVVIPVYNCSNSINELCNRIIESVEGITKAFEIIMVNDSSPDESWEIIKSLSKSDSRIKGIRLSKNFGQHNAINAGLEFCNGEWIVVMDCDLQDSPEEIINLFNKASEGYNIVFSQRDRENVKFLKRKFTKLFYWIFNFLTNMKSNKTANFGIYHSKVINEYKRIDQSFKVFPIVMRQIGFKSTTLKVSSPERPYGKSSYSWRKLFTLSLEIIISQSNKPLLISIFVGFFIALFAFLYGLLIIIRYFMLDVPIGYTSIITAILFTSGLLLCNLGLFGIYLGKVFNEVKGRPPYFIESKTF